ncbi:adenylate/guanylate cyclase domain-containing protein [Mesorhizobium sp. 10J20-29]
MGLRDFSFAGAAGDPAELKAEKFAIFLVAICCCIAGCIWAAMYYALFGPGLTPLLPLVFVLAVGVSLVVAHVTGNHRIAAYSQIVGIIALTAVVQWHVGGIFDSGFVMAWAFCGPIVALMYFSVRESAFWLVLYLVCIAITGAFDDQFAVDRLVIADETRTLFFLMNVGFSSVVVFVFASFFVQGMRREREESNRLLLNILPEKTARQLKSKGGTIAERYDHVSILFADIVNFTAYARERQPEEIVQTLNRIFTMFDRLVDEEGLEKIKTIGDAYMVAGGLSERCEDHPRRMASLALDMMASMEGLQRDGAPFMLRIGLHIGPAIAGVIGKTKFAYDLWGDAVNAASRMESTGVDGRIQVSEAFRQSVGDGFAFEERGGVEIKGRGRMHTYFLTGRA